MRTREDLRRWILAAWTLLTFMMVGLVSCSHGQEDLPELPDSEGGFRIGLELTVAVPTGSTRAPEGDYDPGQGWENNIDLDGGDYRILVFSHHPDVDNRDMLIGELTDLRIELLLDGPSSKTYSVSGSISKEAAEAMTAGNSKIAVFANWGDYTAIDRLSLSEATLSDIWKTAQFSFAAMLEGERQHPLGPDNLMPYYGITNPLAPVEFDGNLYASGGTIHLLRALAKVELQEMENSVEIESVRIRRYNTKGFLLPYHYRTRNEYLKGSYDNDYSQLPHIPEASEAEEGVIYFNHITGSSSWTVYLPEFDNLTPLSDATRSRIEVKFKGYDSYETLYFSRYSTPESNGISVRGADFDVLRNNWYRYRIFKNLQVTVDVIPYIGVDLHPEFGFDDLLPRPPSDSDVPPWVDIYPDEP